MTLNIQEILIGLVRSLNRNRKVERTILTPSTNRAKKNVAEVLSLIKYQAQRYQTTVIRTPPSSNRCSMFCFEARKKCPSIHIKHITPCDHGYDDLNHIWKYFA